jgi:hypothetical protein
MSAREDGARHLEAAWIISALVLSASVGHRAARTKNALPRRDFLYGCGIVRLLYGLRSSKLLPFDRQFAEPIRSKRGGIPFTHTYSRMFRKSS